ncbi:MAG TPA: hypothetical protein VM282_21015 [Acidimicrobiales bacterium]|nr:hypothetical protein [Acidimicrobiales bacterium]
MDDRVAPLGGPLCESDDGRTGAGAVDWDNELRYARALNARPTFHHRGPH